MGQLEELWEEVEKQVSDALGASAKTRSEVERQLSEIEETLSQIESHLGVLTGAIGNFAKMPGSMGNPEEFLENLPGESNRLKNSLARILPAIDEVTDPSIIERHGDIVEFIRLAIEEGSSEIIAALSEARENGDVLVDDIEQVIKSHSGEIDKIEESINKSIEDITSHMVDLTGDIKDRLEDLISAVNDCTSALREGTTESFLRLADELIGKEAEQLLETTRNLADQGTQGIREISDRLSEIMDKLRVIIDLVEPIKPVLDLASSVA